MRLEARRYDVYERAGDVEEEEQQQIENFGDDGGICEHLSTALIAVVTFVGSCTLRRAVKAKINCAFDGRKHENRIGRRKF